MNSSRLHVTDAEYTETIHTDMGNQGFDQPITLASFYPNWGGDQPGKKILPLVSRIFHKKNYKRMWRS
jgi:Lipase